MAKNMTSSGVEAVFKNYAKQGDKMTIGFDPTSRKITSINVDTYMDEPKDAVTLAVQMASLPDGANYAQQSVLDATAKQLKVITYRCPVKTRTESTGYRALGIRSCGRSLKMLDLWAFSRTK
jgi:hypothetical protein